MPRYVSVHLGELEYSEELAIEFSEGLPAFEQERRFLPVERASTAPFVFLQSLLRAELTFLTLPVGVLVPHYELELAAEDRQKLGLPAGGAIEIGRDIVCLAIVTWVGDEATANLLAPVVINPAARKAIQFIQSGSRYPLRYPLPGWGGGGACS